MKLKTGSVSAKGGSPATTGHRYVAAGAAPVNTQKERAQLAELKKVLGQAQLAVEELRRARKVDAKSLSEPFTV